MKNQQPQGIAKSVSLANGPDGKPNGSYQFHGNNTSYIDFPNNGSLDVEHSITMLCWVYFSQNTTGPLFIYSNNTNKSVGMYIQKNKLLARITGMNKGQKFTLKLKNKLVSNQWHYVGASYNHDAGKLNLWVNGKKRRHQNVETQMTLATTYDLRMGSQGNYHFFMGRIAAVQVYNVALNKQQIEAARYAACRGKNMN